MFLSFDFGSFSALADYVTKNSSDNYYRSDEVMNRKVFKIKTRENQNQVINEPSPKSLNTDDISEFVAKVKGGLSQAKLLANKLDLKLVKQVFEHSNYFLFRQEKNSKGNTMRLLNEYVNDDGEQEEDGEEEGHYINDFNNIHRNNNVTGEAELKRFKRVRKRFRSKRSLKPRLRRSVDFNELNKLKIEPTVIN